MISIEQYWYIQTPFADAEAVDDDNDGDDDDDDEDYNGEDEEGDGSDGDDEDAGDKEEEMKLELDGSDDDSDDDRRKPLSGRSKSFREKNSQQKKTNSGELCHAFLQSRPPFLLVRRKRQTEH